MNNKKLVVAGALMLSALIGGLASQWMAPGEVFAPVDVIFTLLALLLLFFWFRLDSDERSYRRSPLLNVGVIALPVVALPYYFFRTRGAARGLGASLTFLGAVLVYSLLEYAGAYVAYVAGRS